MRENRQALDAVVAVLMEKEEIGFEEVEDIFSICRGKLPVMIPVPSHIAA